MASILNRLYRIARSAIPRPREQSAQRPGHEKGWTHRSHDQGPAGGRSGQTRGADDASTPGTHDAPTQVVADLAVFNLTPPASLEEVRKARNREIKKYHSDRFLHDPDRFETSKKIMQIYNAAYDRLKAYYRKDAP